MRAIVVLHILLIALIVSYSVNSARAAVISLSVNTKLPSYHRAELVTISGRLVNDTRPVADGLISIIVKNPRGSDTGIGSYRNIVSTDSTGFYSDAYRLPSEPILGSYTVEVTASARATKVAANSTSFSVTDNWLFDVVWETNRFVVAVLSNSSLSDFAFNQPAKTISFSATGSRGTGFTNVTIPRQLLGGPYTLLLDGQMVTPSVSQNATHASIYTTYSHSTRAISIVGTTVIPEFPVLSLGIILASALAATGGALALGRRRGWKGLAKPS